MNIYSSSTLLIGVLCLKTIAYCQTTSQPEYLHSNVVPPSPSVAALDKFVDIPISKYTGTPNINIPIWTAEGRSLSVPISLSYHASGVRVDKLPGWVGSNWALNAGGHFHDRTNGVCLYCQYSTRNPYDSIPDEFFKRLSENGLSPYFILTDRIYGYGQAPHRTKY